MHTWKMIYFLHWDVIYDAVRCVTRLLLVLQALHSTDIVYTTFLVTELLDFTNDDIKASAFRNTNFQVFPLFPS